jgi:hypothetical protein
MHTRSRSKREVKDDIKEKLLSGWLIVGGEDELVEALENAV